MTDQTPRDYSENERRLLSIAAQREIELRELMQLAAETVRELTAEIAARDDKLARIAELCRVSTHVVTTLRDIEAVLKGDEP